MLIFVGHPLDLMYGCRSISERVLHDSSWPHGVAVSQFPSQAARATPAGQEEIPVTDSYLANQSFPSVVSLHYERSRNRVQLFEVRKKNQLAQLVEQ